MADQVRKPMSEADKSKARVDARKAKAALDRTLRGHRDLSQHEKYAIETLRMAIKACDAAISSVNIGGGFSGAVLTAASQLCQAYNAGLSE